MKKLFTFLTLALFAAGTISAQTADKTTYTPPKRFVNLGYVMQDIKFESVTFEDGTVEEGETVSSKIGVSIETGRTYFLHKTPIAGMIRIGIDASFLDLQYSQFEQEFEDENGALKKEDLHYATYGWRFGPSVTVSPIEKLNLKAYVQYCPSVALSAPGSWDSANYGYAGFIAGGVSASWSKIAVGVELRGANCKWKGYKWDDDSADSGDIKKPDVKAKLPATRLIVGFRF